MHEACFYRAGTLAVRARAIAGGRGPGARARAADGVDAATRRCSPSPSTATGRVVVVADSDLFGDDCLGELDHEDLWLNLVHWAAGAAFRRAAAPVDASAVEDAPGRR